MENINIYLQQIENNISKLQKEQRVLVQYSEYTKSLEHRISVLSYQNDMMKRMLSPKQLDTVLKHNCQFCDTYQPSPCRGTHDALDCPVIPLTRK